MDNIFPVDFISLQNLIDCLQSQHLLTLHRLVLHTPVFKSINWRKKPHELIKTVTSWDGFLSDLTVTKRRNVDWLGNLLSRTQDTITIHSDWEYKPIIWSLSGDRSPASPLSPLTSQYHFFAEPHFSRRDDSLLWSARQSDEVCQHCSLFCSTEYEDCVVTQDMLRTLRTGRYGLIVYNYISSHPSHLSTGPVSIKIFFNQFYLIKFVNLISSFWDWIDWFYWRVRWLVSLSLGAEELTCNSVKLLTKFISIATPEECFAPTRVNGN